jgi:threonylcarbamoyladenosine tRNA methylthiotransferase MtaB
MRVHLHTFGCKANQYDTERMRQALEGRGWTPVDAAADAELVVLNTCTVTARADAAARRMVRRVLRDLPGARIVVAGCSAARDAERYQVLLGGKGGVVAGQDPAEVAEAATPALSAPIAPSRQAVGAPELLARRTGGTRGWLKIQDGCDRKCSFCATRLARGASRSRTATEILAEARLLARHHAELVLTGIHIGHWGRDLDPPAPLASLVAALQKAIPGARFRLGSIEATEVDDALLDLLAGPRNGGGGGSLAPHLHMPLQSGSDRILRAMRRWHTREDYRVRTLEIAERVCAATGGALGLGADIITGFPGETDEDHAQTVALVEELPFTYLHVFPFSPREGTAAAELARENPVPQRVAAERARELRELGHARGEAYLASRAGARVQVVVERAGPDGKALGLTEDYLRIPVEGVRSEEGPRLHPGTIRREGDRCFADVEGGQDPPS